ncbi:Fic family protein [Candidatus Gottesmanbacteria bacterium]|nr:Fic family protein [Candidatus Gottesmanbacteria bacterium]
MKRSSTKPQGATSYKETAFGIIPRSKLLQLEIEGTKRGLDYIGRLTKDKGAAITPEFICRVHDVSFGWIFPRWAGKYRTTQVTFSGKEAPPSFQVPELVINLCKDLAERLTHLPSKENERFIIEVVSMLAWFQHRFVFIHPFRDYNGRTARMLTILILLKLNLPPIEIKVEKDRDRKTYLTAMQKADNGDYSLLERLISDTLTEALQ